MLRTITIDQSIVFINMHVVLAFHGRVRRISSFASVRETPIEA